MPRHPTTAQKACDGLVLPCALLASDPPNTPLCPPLPHDPLSHALGPGLGWQKGEGMRSGGWGWVSLAQAIHASPAARFAGKGQASNQANHLINTHPFPPDRQTNDGRQTAGVRVQHGGQGRGRGAAPRGARGELIGRSSVCVCVTKRWTDDGTGLHACAGLHAVGSID